MCNHRQQNGFTLAEVLISLALVGTLAAMMYPMLINNVAEERLLQNCKEGAAQVALAYVKFQKDASIGPTTTTDAIFAAGMDNYVRRFPDPNAPGASGSNLAVQVQTGGGVQTIPCDAGSPCYVLQSGAILQYDADANFNGSTPNVNGIRFIVDPDGNDVQIGSSFIMFANGRITTEANAPGAILSNDNRVTGIADPAYLATWTGG